MRDGLHVPTNLFMSSSPGICCNWQRICDAANNCTRILRMHLQDVRFTGHAEQIELDGNRVVFAYPVLIAVEHGEIVYKWRLRPEEQLDAGYSGVDTVF